MSRQQILDRLDWRSIGPTRGGRVTTVSGDPAHLGVFYFGSTGGGVWKTDDAGSTWQNVSDGYFRRSSVGALAVAPSDPNVIYAGMGESTIRGNVSHGDGIYRSTDAGQTWQHIGLGAVRHIGRVVIHPTNPDLVWVAAFGHAHGPSAERGVYRSRDGGSTWQQVLFVNERTGANFLEIDPTNPRILYACFWEAERGPHYLNSGGPGSAIFRSTDGGDTWQEITKNPGMPEGNKGKMEIAIAASGNRIWAIVEADQLTRKNGVYRSEDRGETWQQLSSDTNLTGRPWYFNHIRADPRDPNTVWVLNFEIWRSVDGGATYSVVAGPHADYHDLWIDPANTDRVILAGDGGGCVSVNGGQSWSTIYNQPTGEFYHAAADTRYPYRVYGAQQDNTTMSVPSRSDTDAIALTDWYEIGGGESGYIAIRPDDPDIIYAGAQAGTLTRYDHGRAQVLDIAVWPESVRGAGSEAYKFRTNWTSPTLLAPDNPDVLYYGSNVVHRSTSGGRAWEVISPDLTRADPETLHSSGGEITKDNSGAEVYATVFTIAISPLDPQVIWAGSDDGLVHISRDRGATWDDATPSTIPDWALMSLIEASPHDPATAWLAATRYKLNDFHPYIYVTHDYGTSWTRITNGIPDDIFTRVVREDPIVPGLLYAGSEVGIYVSFDAGANWQPMAGTSPETAKVGLPVVPIHDLVVVGDELLVCTHGRAFWILDDLTLVRQLAGDNESDAARLFQPKDTVRSTRLSGFGNAEVPGRNYLFVGGIVQTYIPVKDQWGQTRRRFLDAGHNPDDGVVFYYILPEAPKEPVSLTIFDAAGAEIRAFRSKPLASGAGNDTNETYIPSLAGLNRFVWNMRHADAVKLMAKGGDQPSTVGPRAIPSDYEARLSVGQTELSQRFTILKDPRYEATPEDLQAQLDFLLKIRGKLSETNTAINRIRSAREQIGRWVARAERTSDGAKIGAKGRQITESIDAIEAALIQVRANSPKDTLNLPVMLNSKLGRLAGAVASADEPPTKQAVEVFEELSARIDAQVTRLHGLLETELPSFNALVAQANIDPVAVGDN